MCDECALAHSATSYCATFCVIQAFSRSNCTFWEIMAASAPAMSRRIMKVSSSRTNGGGIAVQAKNSSKLLRCSLFVSQETVKLQKDPVPGISVAVRLLIQLQLFIVYPGTHHTASVHTFRQQARSRSRIIFDTLLCLWRGLATLRMKVECSSLRCEKRRALPELEIVHVTCGTLLIRLHPFP